MIYFTGDTHGLIDFKKLKVYFENNYVTKKDYLIILGDIGIIWDENNTDGLMEYSLLGIQIIFIDGNHENFDLLNKFPIVEHLGAKMHRITSNIYHVLRGEIMVINNLSFLCIGGACSIDRNKRIEHQSWWKDEEITDDDLNNAVNNLSRYNNKVNYVLTHCVDSDTLIKYFDYKPDTSTDKLNILKKIVNYDYWFLGHYHIDDYLDEKHRVFYENIYELKAYYQPIKKIKYNYYYFDDDMYSPKGRKVKLTPDDLPEWFYESRDCYYNLKDVKDLALKKTCFDNHISKYSYLFLSYDKVHQKDEQSYPINENDYEVCISRAHLTHFILGLEKYSPDLDLKDIKAQINIIYDQYANNESNYNQLPPVRPYPEIKTPILKSINYSVYHNNKILLNFKEYELARTFAERYAKEKFDSYSIIEQEESKIINSKLNNDYLIIKKVEGEKVNYGFRSDY